MYYSYYDPFEFTDGLETIKVTLDKSTVARKNILSQLEVPKKDKVTTILLVETPEEIRDKIKTDTISFVRDKMPTNVLLHWDIEESVNAEKISRYRQIEKEREAFYEEHKIISKDELDEKPSLFSESVWTNNYQTSLDSLLWNASRKLELFKNYGGKYNNPTLDVDFQRDLVWTQKQKEELIKSLIRGLPIGSFFINKNFESPEVDYVLYDGKQRLDAIKSFLSGEFPIHVNDKEYYLKDLPKADVYSITNARISVIESNISTMEELIEYYITINTAGRNHTEGDIEKARELLMTMKS